MNYSEIGQLRFSSRGRVTIPAELRRRIEIKPGRRFPIEAREDGTLLIRVKAPGKERKD